MEKERINILKSEIESQVEDIEHIYSKIQERAQGTGKFQIEGLSLWLHNLYCAFEDMFKLIAKAFENNIEEEGRYHIELLKRMRIDMRNVRPALISSDDSYQLLDNLRSFRHLLRHAYMYDLDERKVRLVYDDAMKLKSQYKHDIDNFFKQLMGTPNP